MSDPLKGFVCSLMVLGIVFTGPLNLIQAVIVIVGSALCLGSDLVVWLQKRRKKRADCGCPTPCN